MIWTDIFLWSLKWCIVTISCSSRDFLELCLAQVKSLVVHQISAMNSRTYTRILGVHPMQHSKSQSVHVSSIFFWGFCVWSSLRFILHVCSRFLSKINENRGSFSSSSGSDSSEESQVGMGKRMGILVDLWVPVVKICLRLYGLIDAYGYIIFTITQYRQMLQTQQ